MNYLLISPRLTIQKGDFLGSGVPYWPLELATLAAFLRNEHHYVEVLDLFGLSPRCLEEKSDHYLQGLDLSQALALRHVATPDVIMIFGISFMSHSEILCLIPKTRLEFPNTPIAILENSQAVTAYAIDQCAEAFFNAGADFLVCGEPYWNWSQIESAFSQSGPVPGNMVFSKQPRTPQRIYQKNLSLPYPAWDLFPIQNYWRLPYSHGPKTKRFLPMLTSRGCPWPCDFCVVPTTNNKRWRSRDADEVVAEMLFFRDNLGVYDFQIEDLNPTVFWPRIKTICELLIEKNVGIRFYFVSGTKAETIPLEGVDLLARAGCQYISMSPESGSADLMKKIGKRFDYDHAFSLVSLCRQKGIATQTCFLVGHPHETEIDFKMTEQVMKTFVRSGASEVAIFIVAPFAGSLLYQEKSIKLKFPKATMSFTPVGRMDFDEVTRRRSILIRGFFVEKLKRGPDLWLQGLRSLFGTPKTKMENLPRRFIFLQILFFTLWIHRIYKRDKRDL